YQQFLQTADRVFLEEEDLDAGPRKRLPREVRMKRCEDALAVYRVVEQEHWAKALGDSLLTPEQVTEVQERVVELLNQVLLLEVKEGASPDVLKRALQRLERLEGLHGPTQFVWRFRALCYLHLNNKAAANEAAQRMKETPARTAQDFELLGTLNLSKDPAKAALFFKEALKI